MNDTIKLYCTTTTIVQLLLSHTHTHTHTNRTLRLRTDGLITTLPLLMITTTTHTSLQYTNHNTNNTLN